MRCLVTGGTGFIGSHVVKRLLKEGLDVAVLLRGNSSQSRIREHLSDLSLFYGELDNICEIGEKIKAYQPDVVVHTGWGGVTRGQRNNYDQQIRTNLLGSMELLRICVEAGCSTWIGLGSQAEYGSTNEILEEVMQPNPDTLYGAAKLSLGLLSQVFCKAHGTKHVWLRLTAAYGPMDEPSHLIPYTITTLLRNEVPSLTRGEQRWDYLYIDDVVNAIWLVILKQEVEGIYNLSAGYAVLIRKLCELIRDRIRPELALGFDQQPYNPGERLLLLASNHRFCQTTGWSPAISLDEGLEKTIAWYAMQPANQ